ncbi:MAG: hypothetical protein KGJ09_08170 [Candidatus Omnitrophica bacterium]|nr:hypothetical protein [Candidatus Omnitrophota bacterium]MDE2010036.1 hypothetical protein [Candidatus Omnitrophota bacterium]
MPLKIKTFNNTGGSSALFKALGHPLTAARMKGLIKTLSSSGRIAVYDPLGHAQEWEALYELSSVKVASAFVQNVADIGRELFGKNAQPVTALKNTDADAVFVSAFDAARLVAQIRHLLPQGIRVYSFDDVRLADEFLSNTRNYLDPLNFATNFVFFREEAGHHTRLVTANYWAGYSPKTVGLWCCLFDKDGKTLAQWNENLQKSVHTITLDSREIKQRLKLGDFTGSLFVHFTGIAGHDVAKYALDTYGDDDAVLSCTHDANPWPADLYAGLPAPKEGHQVLLWVQNSHPCPIPANGLGLSYMGSDDVVTYDQPIPGFATCAIDVADLFPQARWPQQFEVHAGRYFVRPRYEVIDAKNRRLIAHTNVERTDLKSDPAIKELSKVMGKVYILPMPVLPVNRWQTIVLPTPMSTAQKNLPLTLMIYNSKGKQMGAHSLGLLDRANIKDYNINHILGKRAESDFPGGFGHAELIYDFSQGGEADGWLHALMRYEDAASGHNTETSFGSHIFNTVMVYKNEPQSYAGKPPGLTTRLFLRLGRDEGTDTLCHLIYPASTPWHAQSTTELILTNSKGEEVLKKTVHIACSGSLFWSYHEMFGKEERQRAGRDAYIIIRDTTCRLFGYHGLMKGEKSFCLDHMFGF